MRSGGTAREESRDIGAGGEDVGLRRHDYKCRVCRCRCGENKEDGMAIQRSKIGSLPE